jgi:hypothetical protein
MTEDITYIRILSFLILTKSIDALGLLGANGLGIFGTFVVRYLTIIRNINLEEKKKKITRDDHFYILLFSFFLNKKH